MHVKEVVEREGVMLKFYFCIHSCPIKTEQFRCRQCHDLYIIVEAAANALTWRQASTIRSMSRHSRLYKQTLEHYQYTSVHNSN